MDKKVTVLTPNGRRQNVRVNPNTTLLQILEEACRKHDFASDEYCLKHHNKEVDLTLMFRFSGLPNNALLEMQQTEKKRTMADVDICVQLEDGSRLQGQFKPSVSLWAVVEELSANAAAEYASPVVLYMRQEIIGKDNLLNTSLKNLGITEGRAMIRFINKNPEDLKIQANVYIPPVVKEKTEDAEFGARTARTTAAGAGGFAITKDLVQALKKTASNSEAIVQPNIVSEEMDATNIEREKPKYDWGSGIGHTIRRTEEDLAQSAAERAESERLAAAMEIEPEVHILGERSAILYSLDSNQKQLEDLPDSFFELTVHDLKLVLRDLKKVATGNEDTPLLTEKMRELEDNKTMLNKIAQYKNCVIRVQFPDRHVLQGMFKPIEKVSDVVAFVRKFLQHSDSDFYLFTIPPKTVLILDKTLLELDLVPTAVVHFSLAEDNTTTNLELDTAAAQSAELTFIREDYLEKLTTAEGALYTANKLRISNRTVTTTTAADTLLPATQHETRAVPTSGTSSATGAIPKRPRNEEALQQPTS